MARKITVKIGVTYSPPALRKIVFAIARDTCEWPGCTLAATELAHLHSTGHGGRKSGHTIANSMAACSDHARISDGERGSGGSAQYHTAHTTLWEAAGWGETFTPPTRNVAWCRAEALTEYLAAERGEWLEPEGAPV